ncbi:unnamed protein product [Amoebophrya sp. A120]|nr:unnamed protein product [Amoebophrya sp. A120]|eukprot:GSA120T00012880001.1
MSPEDRIKSFEIMFGIRLKLDGVAPEDTKQARIMAGKVLDQFDRNLLLSPTDPTSLLSMLRCVPCSFLKKRKCLDEIVVVNDLKMGGFSCGGLAYYQGPKKPKKVFLNWSTPGGWRKNAFFHEIYHMIDFCDDNVNDPHDKEWKALHGPGFRYNDETLPRVNKAVSLDARKGVAPAGFACSYGMTNVREDKACLMAHWMTMKRDLVARNEPVLMKKVKILENELRNFDPAFQRVFLEYK